MYKATCYNVMIVSPSDVIREREIVRQLLAEWNSINSDTTKIVLQPIGWDINAFPSMDGHPQNVLNSQLLERADILIGIFWTRIGTATDEHLSGAVEEIEKHRAGNKPTLLYFSNAPVLLDSVDTNQYKSLGEYKESLRTKGLYQQYSSVDEFEKLLNKHLNLLINKLKSVEAVGVGEISDETAATSKEDEILHLLTDDDKMLLKEALQDSGGYIFRIHSFGGLSVQTNSKGFGSEKHDPKVEAELEEALKNLEQYGLIYTDSYKRQTFRVTAEGYRVAEMINEE